LSDQALRRDWKTDWKPATAEVESVAAPVRSEAALAATAPRPCIAVQVLFRSTDILAVLAAGILAKHVFGPALPGAPLAGFALLLGLAIGFAIVGDIRGLYRDELVLLHHMQALPVATAWLQFAGLAALLPFLLHDLAPDTALEWESTLRLPSLLVAMLFGAPAAILLGRTGLMAACQASGLRAQAASRVLIFGTGAAARGLAQELSRDPAVRTAVLAFLAPAGSIGPATIDGLPVLQLGADIVPRVARLHADTVLLPLRFSDGAAVEQAARQLAELPLALRVVPDFAMQGIPLQQIDRNAAMPMVVICAPPLPALARFAKRVEDLVLAPLLLLLAAPIMAAAAMAIRLESPGPVIFRQCREGANCMHFTVFKFRTMRHDRADPDGATQTVRRDPRVTRVGAFLRRSNIDELPQLLNVLRGEMSLVGPRPHALMTRAAGLTFEDAVATYRARLRVKPGITGWAQVNGWRGETDTLDKIQRRVEHDLWYISNWSIGLDLVILMRTLTAMLRGRNTY